ncbi:hypothetical protein [Streptosporangium sp. NPDC048865]|uniref:hypothetical protein n=1 Tax=Streptosporangium sp. NPDC048865 TaxID=3155766 RepID=UPI003446E927
MYEIGLWILAVVVVVVSVGGTLKYGFGQRGEERAALARIKRRKEKEERNAAKRWEKGKGRVSPYRQAERAWEDRNDW